MITRGVTAIVLSLAACAAAADDLGRMFFTPGERATLDKSRKQNNRAEPDVDAKPLPPPVPQDVSVTGMIRRSDGKYTIWLNNHVVDERQTSAINAGMSRRENQVRLKIPEGGRSVDLKVGQTLEIFSGAIEENYARRAAAKSAASAAANNADSASDVSKVMPLEPREPVKPESLARKRPARDSDSEDAEDPGSTRRIETR